MIHKTPIIGGFITAETHYIYGKFAKGGIITKIAGKRIYYKELRYDLKDHCKVARDEQGNILESSYGESYIMKFSAVCDTIEEYESLLEFQEKCRKEFHDLLKRQEAEANQFFNTEK